MKSNFPTPDRIARCGHHHSMRPSLYDTSGITHSKNLSNQGRHPPAETVTIGCGTKPMYKGRK